MYAVIIQGGKQYVVKEGEEIRVDLLPNQVGENVNINEVLLIGETEGGAYKIGSPFVPGAAVEAVVTKTGKEPKIYVFKKKCKIGYHKKQGHRENYTALKVLKIKES